MSFVIGLIIVLGVLIFVHELGHFLCAKAFGVGVEKFSLGFGPKILSKIAGRTDYRLSAIPLGGYVKMVGEQPDEILDPADIPFSFTHKPVWQRMIIVAAGPVFNFLLAIVIFFGIFWSSGLMLLQPIIGEVTPGSPAERAGLLNSDFVTAIDGRPIESWTDLSETIMMSDGKPLQLTVRRGKEILMLSVTPADDVMKNPFGENQHRYIIGVKSTEKTITRQVGPVDAFKESLSQTYLISKLTVLGIVKVLQGSISPKNIGGPIMIAQMAGEQVEQGFINLLAFIAYISVSLGILNLLPVPVLDGGHLLFYSIEAIIRRPVSIKTREIAQQIGVFLLLTLMVFVFYNDIMRFFE
ncbi:MAG: RIP metalloprotease RseP [Desulfosalsimonadaceae bacterium]|nr:RIP metalloprotease RseP [Desulfosalsimonadaceae bacterium]